MIDFSDINTTTLAYFFMASVISFTICISIFSIKTINRDIWIISNIIGIFGILFFTNMKNQNYVDIGASLTILSGSLKSLSFTNKKFLFRRYIFGNLFFVLSLFCAFIVTFYPDAPFRRNYFLFGMLFSLAASLIFLLKNREWHGLKQKGYVVATFTLGIVAILFVVAQNIPYDPNLKLVDTSTRGVANFMALCVASVAIQLIFLSLIFGQSERVRVRALRRNNRLLYEIELKQAVLIETQAVADERYQLLKMLTHEVRQPLNTAQAALDTISQQLGRGQTEPADIQQTVGKAQSTLNSVVLSISNSILGATLITQGRPSQLQSIDLCDVSRLALFDLGQSQRSRIQQKFEQPTIYADADPIILRLAIRNLLENACKYSPSGTPILFELVTDEAKLALVIRVTNTLSDQSTLSADIFERNKRGVDSLYEGSGLGLYIVRKVAELHKGDVSYHLGNGNQVAFELTIPA